MPRHVGFMELYALVLMLQHDIMYCNILTAHFHAKSVGQLISLQS